MAPPLLAILLAVVGLWVGMGLAWISRWLPQKRFVLQSRRTLAFALASALVGALSCIWAMVTGQSASAAVLTAVLGWQLLLIAVVDAENFWLPDILTVPLGLTGLLASVLLPYPLGMGWTFALISGLAGFSILWLVSLFYRKMRGHSGLGGGDPILFGMGAVWVGAFDLLAVTLIAAATALLMALVLKLFGRKIGLKTRLPFGTYLAIGFAVCWLMI